MAKTLIIPKLNHLFISLPNPSQETISNLTTQLFRFIWGSDCDKVKRTIVTQHHLQGGLNMLNLRNFILSLKCSWIQRLIKGNHSWLSILKNNYGQDVIDKRLNTGNDYVKKMLKCTSNVFWKDVLESWLFVNSKDLENVNLTQPEILSTPVRFNSYITVNKKSIFNFIKESYEKGVKIIDEFLDNNGSFYAREYFVEKYDINYMCFMKYNGITCAIATFLRGTHFSMQGKLFKITTPFLTNVI